MDEEKRRLRSQRRAEAKSDYKELITKTRSVARDDSPTRVQKLIKTNLTKSDELYSVVKKHLDGTLSDSKLVRNVIELGSENAKRINVTSAPFNLKKAVLNILKSISSDQFDDYVLNEYIRETQLIAPTYEYFYGAVRSEELQQKTRKQRIREKVVETQAVTAAEKDVEVDVEQDSTPKEVEHIAQKIRQLTKRKPRGYPFLKALVDPNSFSKTVENIFHSAFLVKEGVINLRDNHEEGPLMTINEEAASRDGTQNSEPKREAAQVILSFTVDDFKRWIQKM